MKIFLIFVSMIVTIHSQYSFDGCGTLSSGFRSCDESVYVPKFDAVDVYIYKDRPCTNVMDNTYMDKIGIISGISGGIANEITSLFPLYVRPGAERFEQMIFLRFLVGEELVANFGTCGWVGTKQKEYSRRRMDISNWPADNTHHEGPFYCPIELPYNVFFLTDDVCPECATAHTNLFVITEYTPLNFVLKDFTPVVQEGAVSKPTPSVFSLFRPRSAAKTSIAQTIAQTIAN